MTKLIIALIIGVAVAAVGIVCMFIPVLSFWPVPTALVGVCIAGGSLHEIEKQIKRGL